MNGRCPRRDSKKCSRRSTRWCWFLEAVRCCCCSPIVAMTLFDPVTLFSLFSGIALCYVLIAVGAWTANRAARTLNTVGYRADD